MSIMEGWKPWQEVEAAAERQRQEAECFRWIEKNRENINELFWTQGAWTMVMRSHHIYTGDTLLAAILSARQEGGK